MPETRSTKTPKPLSEDEVKILQDQLLIKQQRLAEQEKLIQDRARDTENTYKQLQKRESEFMDRERQQAERLAAEQAMINQQQVLADTSGAAYGNSQITENATIMDTLRTLIRDVANFKDDLAEIRDIRRQSSNAQFSTPSRPPRAPAPIDLQAPRLTYKEALESVPTFDGESTPVLKFARACNRLKEMFPLECEPTLTRLLRNKLRGKAYTAVEDDIFLTIDAFVDQLKTIFGASKSVNQYRGELGNIAKGKNEHVIDYISRVKDLHCAIIEGESKNLGPLTRDREQYFENETLLCFLSGLPPDFRVRLRLEGYNNLSSAYATAIRVEKEIDRDRAHFSNKSEPKTATAPAQVKTSTTDKRGCEHCNKTGHAIEKCWLKNPELRPNRSNTDKRERTKGAICDYCSKPGHTREQCFKLRNDEKRKSGNGDSRPSSSGASRSEKIAEHPVKTSQMLDQANASTDDESSDMQMFG